MFQNQVFFRLKTILKIINQIQLFIIKVLALPQFTLFVVMVMVIVTAMVTVLPRSIVTVFTLITVV